MPRKIWFGLSAALALTALTIYAATTSTAQPAQGTSSRDAHGDDHAHDHGHAHGDHEESHENSAPKDAVQTNDTPIVDAPEGGPPPLSAPSPAAEPPREEVLQEGPPAIGPAPSAAPGQVDRSEPNSSNPVVIPPATPEKGCPGPGCNLRSRAGVSSNAESRMCPSGTCSVSGEPIALSDRCHIGHGQNELRHCWNSDGHPSDVHDYSSSCPSEPAALERFEYRGCR